MAEELRQSFDELALPLFSQAYNFAHWLTQSREEAEDLVQETYLKALRGYSSFRPGTNFRAWLYKILRNTFLTSRCGLKQMVAFDDEEAGVPEPAAPDTPESLLLAQADQQVLQRALAQLSVPFREILLLCDVEEMGYQEIADTLAIPIGTVMSRISRARRAMRNLLRAQMKGSSHDLPVAKPARFIR